MGELFFVMIAPQSSLAVTAPTQAMVRVLLTLNETSTLHSLAEELSLSQFAVLTAHDPDECLDLLWRSQPDIVILDARLPTASGLAVCYRIRRESKVPVILLNDYSGSLDTVLALEVGADLCLPKPISASLLSASICRLLKRTPTQSLFPYSPPVSSVFRHGDLTLIPANYEIMVGSRKIQLTVQELGFLSVLMEKPNQFVSLQAIWDRIYSPGTPPKHPAISMLAHRVRSKIEADPKNPRYIIPNRGKGGGYKIVG